MTTEIALTIGILLVTIALLIWERLRVDLIALLVLVTLAFSGLVSSEEALSGFSNPAVITVWAVFILSAGLARTGVANRLGRLILRLSRGRENRTMVVVMLIGAGLSAFMNNVGVAAMLLPVVMLLARKTGQPASHLLMPLAFGTLLGGLSTLIGTPPNILVSEAAQDFGLPAFGFFDFARLGIPITLIGVLYMLVVGKRLLPNRKSPSDLGRTGAEAAEGFDLEERFFTLQVAEHSPLAGKSLVESRLGSALKLNVIGITRGGRTWLAPDTNYQLAGGDELLVVGKSDWLDELRQSQPITLEASEGDGQPDQTLDIRNLVSPRIKVVEAGIPTDSPLIGQSLAQCDFRKKYQANVLAIWRGEKPIRTSLQDLRLRAGDKLLVQAGKKQLNHLRASGDFDIGDDDGLAAYQIEERLLLMAVPPDSHLVGKSLVESHLADAFGLSVLGIMRNGDTRLMPEAESTLMAGDRLLVQGKLEDIEVLRALQELHVEEIPSPTLNELESEYVGLVEAVVSPHSKLDGKTLREINFREKFGLSVLAIWRGGRAFRSNLREMPLRFGDSLLIYGHRDRIQLLAEEADFLVLTPEVQEAPRADKARLATTIMAGVVVSVGLGWLPIQIAAVAGAALMVLTNCLDMEEAYRAIHWQAIFLIAGMLPLGLAMQNSGTAQFLAEQVVALTESGQPLALMAGLFLLTTLATQVMPSPVVAVLMTPVALTTAVNLGFSPQALAMLVAVSASATFMSPVGHPANILVMGPGGYRFIDFIKVGLPLSLVIMATTLLLLPVFWPL